MGASKSKLEKLNKQDKEDCITKVIKIILSNEKKNFKLNYKPYNKLNDFLNIKSSSTMQKLSEKLIDHVDDLSHDSIASSFIFKSANGLSQMTSEKVEFTPQTLMIFYSSLNRPLNNPKHLRVYHDIYYF